MSLDTQFLTHPHSYVIDIFITIYGELCYEVSMYQLNGNIASFLLC